MERIGMPVLIHGEATDPAVDIFDRETVFMEQSLLPLLRDHHGLKVVIEHVTTGETVEIVRAHAPRVAGTITPHHLVINRTSIFQGGLRPHLYCLPVAKREHHRLALRQAVTSGDSCFFIGTDTAPHLPTAKEAECGCAGVFVGATALQTYVQVFDEEGALDRLEAFASLNGANSMAWRSIRYDRTEAPESPSMAAVRVDDGDIVVFRGGRDCPGPLARCGHDDRSGEIGGDGRACCSKPARCISARTALHPGGRLGQPGLYRLPAPARRTALRKTVTQLAARR